MTLNYSSKLCKKVGDGVNRSDEEKIIIYTFNIIIF